MNDETLEIKLKAALAQSIGDFGRLTNQTIMFGREIEKVTTKIDKLGNTTQKIDFTSGLGKYTNQLTQIFNASGEKIGETFKQVENSGNGIKNAISSAFNVNKLYLYWNLTKRLRTTISSMLKNSIDFVETQNKFDITMGTARLNATRFVNRMSESIGIAKAELMDYQSTYKNILGGLGDFTDEQAERVSESLTKMALDYSSLYNVNRSDAMNKFQSALVGSIRPIRSDSGYDVSETTIGAKANSLGIERSIGQLNQMEKRLLRIIVLMDQMRNSGAMNDLARTIEQPANQIRVLQDQVKELGVWLGNVFMGTIGRLLPYINAFVMVLKELAKTLAYFVGFTAGDTELGEAFEVAETSAGGIAGGMGKAAKSAKELKKTLMGFDVLNVIQTPAESQPSGGGGGGGSVGIDPKILNALKDYESTMEKIRMKAADIRDKIMDWLGFTKAIDPLTGEIIWKLKDGYTRIEKILDILKEIGVAIATWKVSSSIAKLFSLLTGTSKESALRVAAGLTLAVTGFFVEYNGISHLINDGADAFTIIKTIAGFGMGTAGLYTIIDTLSKNGILNLAGMNKLKLAFGIALAITAIEIGIQAVKNQNIGLMILSSILLGSSVGLTLLTVGIATPTVAIGIAVVLAVSSFIIQWAESKAAAMKKLSDEIKELKKETEETINSYERLTESTKFNAESELIQLEACRDLKKELDEIVDANGNVKNGYEERADFILGELNSALGTEYTRNGEIIKNYQDMQTEIEGIIEQKKKQIQIEAYEELYKEAIKQRLELEKKQNELQEKKNQLLEEHDKIAANGILNPLNLASMHKWNKAWEDITTAMDENNTALEEVSISTGFYGDKIDELSQDFGIATDSIITDVSDMNQTTTEKISEALEINSRNLSDALRDELLSISNNYKERSNELEKSFKDGEISLIDYQARTKSLTRQYYIDLATAYNKYKDENDETSAKVKKTIEDTFKTAGLDIEEFSNIAKRNSGIAGLNFKEGFEQSAQVDASSLINEGNMKAKGTSFGTSLWNGLKAAFGSRTLDVSTSGKVNLKAGGGPVAMGEMFIAREAGPELIGKIGNTTTVMNNQQIVQAVSQGVAQAVAGVMGNMGGGEYRFYLDGYELTSSVEKRKARLNNIYGTT